MKKEWYIFLGIILISLTSIIIFLGLNVNEKITEKEILPSLQKGITAYDYGYICNPNGPDVCEKGNICTKQNDGAYICYPSNCEKDGNCVPDCEEEGNLDPDCCVSQDPCSTMTYDASSNSCKATPITCSGCNICDPSKGGCRPLGPNDCAKWDKADCGGLNSLNFLSQFLNNFKILVATPNLPPMDTCIELNPGILNKNTPLSPSCLKKESSCDCEDCNSKYNIFKCEGNALYVLEITPYCDNGICKTNEKKTVIPKPDDSGKKSYYCLEGYPIINQETITYECIANMYVKILKKENYKKCIAPERCFNYGENNPVCSDYCEKYEMGGCPQSFFCLTPKLLLTRYYNCIKNRCVFSQDIYSGPPSNDISPPSSSCHFDNAITYNYGKFICDPDYQDFQSYKNIPCPSGTKCKQKSHDKATCDPI